jgi:hypothetical protein
MGSNNIRVGTSNNVFFANAVSGKVAIGSASTLAGTKLYVDGTMFITGKLSFGQTDFLEYIDSLNNGYVDVGATTGIRLLNNTVVTGFVDASTGFKDNGTAGIDTTFVDADGNTITVSGGIITAKTAP